MPVLAAVPPSPAARPRPRSAPADDPEVALMLRVQRDEPGAFAELVDRYGPLIFGRLYRLLGDRQEAEDLTQDVFLRLYRNRKRYQPRARFGTWLYHIAQNVARNALRSRQRHPCVRMSCLDGEELTEAHALPERFEPPSQPLERRELAALVRRAIDDLGGRQRTALEMQQYQDLSYAEIARELDMTPKAAKSLLYRARNQLRVHLTRLLQMA